MINWDYYNKAQQAIWAGDLKRAQEFLAGAENNLREEQYNSRTVLHKMTDIDEKSLAEWDEIINKGVEEYYKRKKRLTEINAMDHIDAALHVCTFLEDGIINIHSENIPGMDYKSLDNVFLSAYDRDENSATIRGYSPVNQLPGYKQIYERLKAESADLINFIILEEDEKELRFIVYGKHCCDYIGNIGIVFAPWFLINGLLTCTTTGVELKKSKRKFLDFLGRLLAA